MKMYTYTDPYNFPMYKHIISTLCSVLLHTTSISISNHLLRWTLCSTNYFTVFGRTAIKQQSRLTLRRSSSSLWKPHSAFQWQHSSFKGTLSAVVSPVPGFLSWFKGPVGYPELIINWSDSCLVLFIVNRFCTTVTASVFSVYRKHTTLMNQANYYYQVKPCQCHSRATEKWVYGLLCFISSLLLSHLQKNRATAVGALQHGPCIFKMLNLTRWHRHVFSRLLKARWGRCLSDRVAIHIEWCCWLCRGLVTCVAPRFHEAVSQYERKTVAYL